MLWTPSKGRYRVDHNVGNVGNLLLGTAVTTGAAATTKGTPAELITATAFDAYWVKIVASGYGASTVASAGSMDIMIGAAGVEDILIPDLLMGYCGGINQDNVGPKTWDFPLYIPAGTRISAQAAGERVSTALRVAIFLYGGNGYPTHPCGSKVTTYGMGTVPAGTAITPGASGAEGSWTQITAATTQDGLAMVPSWQWQADTGILATRSLFLDLGVGAATEEEVAGNFVFYHSSVELVAGPVNGMPAFGSVPSGTRLSARISNAGTNDSGSNAVIHVVS